MWWTTSSGRIELNITKDQAVRCSHPGPCDDDIRELSTVPAVRRQLVKLDRVTVADELKEYGAWDEIELSDHTQNLQRLLWLAAGDISDQAAR